MRRGAGAPRAPLRVRVRPARALAPLALAALLACAAAPRALWLVGLNSSGGNSRAAPPAALRVRAATARARAGASSDAGAPVALVAAAGAPSRHPALRWRRWGRLRARDCALLRASLRALPAACAAPIARETTPAGPGRAAAGIREAPLPLLVTGVGRSGTKFAVGLLRALGLDVAHDDAPPGADGAASWVLAFAPRLANSSGAFAHPLRRDCDFPYFAPAPASVARRFALVLHQVRDPRDVVASRVTNAWLFGDAGYIARRTDIIARGGDNGVAAKALRHWVTWNSWVETVADARYRMEDLAEDETLAGALCAAAAVVARGGIAARDALAADAESVRVAGRPSSSAWLGKVAPSSPWLPGSQAAAATRCPGNVTALRDAFEAAGGGRNAGRCPPNSRKPECVGKAGNDTAQVRLTPHLTRTRLICVRASQHCACSRSVIALMHTYLFLLTHRHSNRRVPGAPSATAGQSSPA